MPPMTRGLLLLLATPSRSRGAPATPSTVPSSASKRHGRTTGTLAASLAPALLCVVSVGADLMLSAKKQVDRGMVHKIQPLSVPQLGS